MVIRIRQDLCGASNELLDPTTQGWHPVQQGDHPVGTLPLIELVECGVKPCLPDVIWSQGLREYKAVNYIAFTNLEFSDMRCQNV
jgi:hypothetical protein